MTTLPLTTAPQSLCVLRLSAIGDVCHTLPVVRTLQARWPQTRITWIIGKTEYGLLQGIPDIRFVVYDKRSGRRGLDQLTRQLGDERFDVLLHMQAALRASRISRHIRAGIKLGFDRSRAKDFQWLFTSHQIAARPRGHVIDGLFGFAEALGIRERIMRWDIPLSSIEKEFARGHIPDGTAALVISPCTSERSRNYRNWLPERYAAVARHAVQRHGMKVLLTGSTTDIEKHFASVITGLCPNAVNLMGATSLKQMLAVLERAQVLLAPDSGPAHMAATVGTPVIGLYAGTNPERAGPAVDRYWWVNRYPDALLKFYGKRVEQVPWGKRVRVPTVMETISTEEVIGKLDQLLETLR